jgi:murein L,D-transpeptidase YafK
LKRNNLIFYVILLTLLLSASTHAENSNLSSARSREALLRIRPKLEKELSEKGLKFGAPVYIRIFKEERILELWLQKDSSFVLFKDYDICTYGGEGMGPKTRQGDGKAPEGFYYVTPGRMNPNSRFHLSFNLGYPNSYDRVHDRTGGALMVHGACVSIGCFAMTDQAIEEIYSISDAALRNGQGFFRVHIFPFRMTEKKMEENSASEWFTFWENLREGYDFFGENGNRPPNVEVMGGKYIFDRF